MTKYEVGTLKEIGAQVGDVVEWNGGERPHQWTITLIRGGNYYEGYDHVDSLSDWPHWRIISRANQGPVREVTRKEIVPGVYGQIRVYDEPCEKGHVCLGSVKVSYHWTVDELTAALDTLTQIRAALA